MHPANATVEISNQARLPTAPLVSVYMLTYQHERFIAQAIEGVVAQQCEFPIELVIGEDCSPDGTREVVLEYQRRHPGLIRVLTSDANVGSRANAARCRAACRGKYIAICEGDDYWTDPVKLSVQVGLLESDPDIAFCFHDVSEVDEEGRAITRSKVERITGARLKAELTSEEIFDGYLIPTLSVVYRNISLARRMPSMNIVNGDAYLFSMLATHGGAKGIDATMGAYRHHPGGVWSSASTSKQHLEALRSYMAIASDVPDEFSIQIATPLSTRIANAWLHRAPSRSGELYPLLWRAYLLSLVCPFKAGLGIRPLRVSAHCAIFPVLRAFRRSLSRRRAALADR